MGLGDCLSCHVLLILLHAVSTVRDLAGLHSTSFTELTASLLWLNCSQFLSGFTSVLRFSALSMRLGVFKLQGWNLSSFSATATCFLFADGEVQIQINEAATYTVDQSCWEEKLSSITLYFVAHLLNL